MKKLQWYRLSRDAQDLYLKILWEDAYTHQAIADFLYTTKGTIVGRQQRHPDLAPTVRGKVDNLVNPERFRDLLELHELEKRSSSRRRPSKSSTPASRGQSTKDN